VTRAWCLVPRGWCRSLLVTLWCLVPAVVSAQVREPLPWFAIDLHAASVGLPTAEGWIPEVSADTPVPGRAWGLAGAVTVYPLRMGFATFGVGAAISSAQGKSDSIEIVQGSGADETTRITPIVRTQVVSLLPQLSINFGHKLGWSYLSAGIGRTRVDSSADAVGTTPQMVVPAAWNQALNFGGGARWFIRRRLGAGFDVRFVKLGSRAASGTIPAARRTQMITFSAGITLQ
jgi:hypothetical protein